MGKVVCPEMTWGVVVGFRRGLRKVPDLYLFTVIYDINSATITVSHEPIDSGEPQLMVAETTGTDKWLPKCF